MDLLDFRGETFDAVSIPDVFTQEGSVTGSVEQNAKKRPRAAANESIETTHKYIVADMKLKENALKKLHEPDLSHTNSRYQAANDILQFLKSL